MREWRNLLTSTHVGYRSVIRAVASGASLKFGVQGASATNWFSRVNGARDNGIRLYCVLLTWDSSDPILGFTYIFRYKSLSFCSCVPFVHWNFVFFLFKMMTHVWTCWHYATVSRCWQRMWRLWWRMRLSRTCTIRRVHRLWHSSLWTTCSLILGMFLTSIVKNKNFRGLLIFFVLSIFLEI